MKSVNKPKKNTKISKSFIKTCTSNIINAPKEIANKFNDYFINIGPSLANKIKLYDNNSFDKYLSGSYQSSLFLNPITEHELEFEIKNMKANKSFGYDGISSKIIKIIAEEISKPLVHIFNLTFSIGTIPDSLKVALVTPIFKGNDEKNFKKLSANICTKLLFKITRKAYD